MVITNHSCYTQFDQIIHQSYKEKTGPLNQLTEKILVIEKTDSAIGIIHQFEKQAKKENDIEAELEARLLMITYLSSQGLPMQKDYVNEMLGLLKIASEKHLLITEARIIKRISSHYWHNVVNYELASDYLLKLDEIIQQLSDDEFPDKVDCFLAIGSCYHFFGDYEKAKIYFSRGANIKETPNNAMPRGSCINSLGVCYRDLNIMDSSDLIFENFLANKNSIAYQGWEGMIAGNLGYNYYLRGEYDKAIPYLLHDKERALRDNDLSLVAGASTPLADIYIYQNRLEEAGNEIKEAYRGIQTSWAYDRFRKLYPVMSKWYSKTGKPDLAIAYMDSTLMAIQKYQEKKNALQLLRASQRSEIEKSNIAILKIQQEKKQKIFIRNLVILTLVFVVLLLIVFFRNRSKRHKQEQLIKDLKIQEHEIELARARDLLAEFSRRISEKNELIEKLEIESQLDENNKVLQELKQSAILTEEDWTRFKRLYEQVYPSFFEKLKNKFPELSPAETRYITLSKLGFNSNEVANCLGISKKSIHVTWYRIRKKLDLPDTKTIDDLVIEVN